MNDPRNAKQKHHSNDSEHRFWLGAAGILTIAVVALLGLNLHRYGLLERDEPAEVRQEDGSAVSPDEETSTSLVRPDSNGNASQRNDPDSSSVDETFTSPTLDPTNKADVLSAACDFERFNGLWVEEVTSTNPVSYQPTLDRYFQLVFEDQVPGSDTISDAEIDAEQTRCAALPSLTFEEGSHPVGTQIEATVYRSYRPAEQQCTWKRTDANGQIADFPVEAGSDIAIVVDPTDRFIEIDGCGLFIADRSS